MPCRQTEYAHRTKAELIVQLGGKCEHCGETAYDKLQFDHINGRDWDPKSKSFSARMSKYKREAAAGILRLLCEPCNLKARKSNDAGQWVPTNSVIERTTEMPLPDHEPF